MSFSSNPSYPPPPPLPSSFSTSSLARSYRKGNWTLHETLTLIHAKRLHSDLRVISPSSTLTTSPRSAELRWKWIENYCWSNGCLRSQNQCNDKWDNLLRDFKKVRDYEESAQIRDQEDCKSSYWSMEKQERKEKNLPSNLASEVFHALMDVVHRSTNNSHCNANRNRRVVFTPVALNSTAKNQFEVAAPQPMQTVPVAPTPPPPPQPLSPLPLPQNAPKLHPSVCEQNGPEFSRGEISESTGPEQGEDEQTEPDWKRRKVRSEGSSVVQDASALVQALLECEEKREKRHRELMELEKRRLKMEAERTEMNRQGFAGLTTAVSSLSAAIHAVVSHNNGNGQR